MSAPPTKTTTATATSGGDANATAFSHEFSGVSVWLEPDPSQTVVLEAEMERLRTRCGGAESGMHKIVPHCTLLYNTSLPPRVGAGGSGVAMERNGTARNAEDGSTVADSPCCSTQGRDENETDACRQQRQQRQGEELLERCLAAYCRLYQQCDSRTSEAPSDDIPCSNAVPPIQMAPTSHYYFPYPKSADDGKGFGCAISLLILETTPELQTLHEVVKSTFPPDERHGSSGDDDRCDDDEEKKSDECNEEASFRPHAALVYAPEGHESVTSGWLEERTNQMEGRKEYSCWIPPAYGEAGGDTAPPTAAATAWDARYLSLWSTEGTLDEWYPIAKLDLLPS